MDNFIKPDILVDVGVLVVEVVDIVDVVEMCADVLVLEVIWIDVGNEVPVDLIAVVAGAVAAVVSVRTSVAQVIDCE